MPNPPIPPALTETEANSRSICFGTPPFPVLEIRNGQFYYDNSYGEYGCDPVNPHKVAALCLYDQPFGFSREDVALLNEIAQDGHKYWDSELLSDEQCARVARIAATIQALLPPELVSCGDEE